MRPRKPSRDAAIEQCERERKRADINGFALSLMLDPQTSKTHIVGKQGYRAVVLDPHRADSGFVVVTWQGPGDQRSDSTAYYVEFYLEQIREMAKSFKLSDPEHCAILELAEKIRRVSYEATRTEARP